jgi:hypothetical protein
MAKKKLNQQENRYEIQILAVRLSLGMFELACC